MHPMNLGSFLYILAKLHWKIIENNQDTTKMIIISARAEFENVSLHSLKMMVDLHEVL